MKKVLSIILALAMLTVMLAGCGSSGGGPSSQKPENSSASPESREESNASGSEPSTEPVTFGLYLDIPWFWVDTWGNDPISQKITELTGVNFEVTRAADNQQIALMIAGGDLPEIVYTDNGATKTALSDSENCYSYNELVSQYGVDIHATETEIEINTSPDGNYYGLANAYTTKESLEAGTGFRNGGVSSITYRTDLYEELGSPKLESLEDLENLLLACKEKHPDIIPMGSYNIGHFLKYFWGQLGIKSYSETAVGYNSENKPIYGLHADGVKDFFTLLNRFAREGLINAEALTYDNDRYEEFMNSGRFFMSIGPCDAANNFNAVSKTNDGQGYHWKLMVENIEDTDLQEVDTAIGWASTYITKQCHDPQRAIEFMSWCRSEEGRKLTSWGIQGEHWDYDSEGRTVTTEAYRNALAEGKSKQEDFGIGMWIFGDQGDENAFMDYATDDQGQMDYYARIREVSAHTATWSELYQCVPTEGDMLNIWNALGDMVGTERMNVIFAESDEAFEQAYQSMQDQAKALGVDELEAWMAQQLEN